MEVPEQNVNIKYYNSTNVKRDSANNKRQKEYTVNPASFQTRTYDHNTMSQVPAVIRLPSVGGLLLLPTPVVASADSEEEEVDVVSTFDNKQSTPDIHRNSL
ncbi:hypothetical protein LSTR_LSTR004620 [Laodelphax striatellus]|uniref:Uncharacterized protein n=1 Tax=Laodelphax striatellus TaxID=195883 RepID=A0A482WUH5_LAOST|nr:hypothetical protein LSTR_LSTR004620 [Laodelphax striatellus]